MPTTSEKKLAYLQASRACHVHPMANGQYIATWPSNGFTHESRRCSYNVAKQERARAVAIVAMELLGYDNATIAWALPLYQYGTARYMLDHAIKLAGPVQREQN